MINNLINKNFSVTDGIILVFGGIAIFLFALDLLKKNLNLIYSQKLYTFIQKTTNTKFRCFLTGIIATILMQSSSGLTAIIISLMAANYLALPQALALMIGSNIGTCLTAFIITINFDFFSLYIICFFFLLYLLFRSEKSKAIISIFICIGLVFLGLDFIEGGCLALMNNSNLASYLAFFQNNTFMSLLVGLLFTVLIQSSSAVIGLLEQLYYVQAINLASSISIMLGSNVGTTLTGYLSAFNTNKEAKQAITANVIFNILGALIFMFLIVPFTFLLQFLEAKYFYYNPKITIASAHLIFNLLSAILGYFCFNQLIYLVNKDYYKKDMNYRIDKLNSFSV